jgi:hypothetical protein
MTAYDGFEFRGDFLCMLAVGLPAKRVLSFKVTLNKMQESEGFLVEPLLVGKVTSVIIDSAGDPGRSGGANTASL